MLCPETSDSNHTVTGINIPEEREPHLHGCEELNTQAVECRHQNVYARQAVFILLKTKRNLLYTGCPRRNGQNFGRVFLMLNYTDITQKTYIQS